jgi:ATP-binding cassette subfamily B protein
MSMPSFPFYKQLDAMDCGPTCLRMVARHYGKHFTLQTLREKSHLSREGRIVCSGIARAAEEIGMQTMGVSLTWERSAERGAACRWWSTGSKTTSWWSIQDTAKDKVYLADPAFGYDSLQTRQEFLKGWISTRVDGEESKGSALLLQPTPDFLNQEDEPAEKNRIQLPLALFGSPYKRYVYHLLLGLVLGSIIQFLLPFLFQSMVDFGITNQRPALSSTWFWSFNLC